MCNNFKHIMRIVIPWRDRAGYVSICLATLKESMRGHDDVHVTLYNNESKHPLPPICKDFGDKMSYCDITAHDCHHVFIDMFNFEFARCKDDFIINMDSDCCVHPGFIDAAKKMIYDLPDLGHASLYNADNHPEPNTILKDIYHLQPHISMTASVVSRAAWAAFPKPKPGEEIAFGCIDGAFSTWVHLSDLFSCYGTIRSYVEHIGAVGAYATQDRSGKSLAHRARRFNP